MRASLPREIAALLLLVATGLVALALGTYHPRDPSWSVAATGQVENAAGPVGAYLADILLRFFGLGAYFLVAGVALEGLSHIKGRWGVLQILTRWFGLLAALLALLGLLRLLPVPGPAWLGSTGTGGILGHLIARALVPYLYPIGAGIVLTALLMGGVVAATGRSWLALLEAIGWATVSGGSRLAARAGQAIRSFLPSLWRSGGRWGSIPILVRGLGLVAALLALLGLLRLLSVPGLAWLGSIGTGGLLDPLIAGGLVSYLHPLGAGLALSGLLLAGLVAATGRSWLALLEAIGWAAVSGAHRVTAWSAQAGRRVLPSLAIGSPPRPRNFLLRLPRPHPLGPEPDPAADLEPSGSLEPHFETGRKEREGGSPPGISSNRPPSHQAKRQASTRATDESESPPLASLDSGSRKDEMWDERQSLTHQARLVESRLADFGVTAQVVEYHSGPVVTRFELELAPGTKVSKVSNLSKDLARSLSVQTVRVIETIPGKPVIGLEVPRFQRETVRIGELLGSPAFQEASSPLTLALGTDISGQPVVTDLTTLPHLLIAGTTGAGKSVGINAMLLSLLYKASPDQVRLILVDPKMLELSVYDGIPHLLAPVVTDMSDATNAFKWCIAEMERRFQLMAHLGVRSLAAYNRQIQEGRAAGRPLTGPSPDGVHDGPELGVEPWLVVIVDELADLMMVAGKQVEESITRLAQKARAAGIHLILATQRPSVDILTGLIKANVPARIAFQVNQRVDSRTILDQGGAEQLLGRGDMLFYPASYSTPRRVHGALVEDHEVEQVVSHLTAFEVPEYNPEVLAERDETGAPGGEGQAASAESDPLYDQAVRIVTESRRASISNVQRRLRVGYNRAARLIDAMEAAGVVGPQQANGGREVWAPPPADG